MLHIQGGINNLKHGKITIDMPRIISNGYISVI